MATFCRNFFPEKLVLCHCTCTLYAHYTGVHDNPTLLIFNLNHFKDQLSNFWGVGGGANQFLEGAKARSWLLPSP